MTATAGSGDWTPVGQATSGLTNGGAPTSAVLALTGSNGYLLAPDGALYSGSIGGTWSQVGTSACEPGARRPTGSRAPRSWRWSTRTSSGSPATGRRPALRPRCTRPTTAVRRGLSRPPPRGRAPTLSGFGVTTSLAAAPNGTLTLATTSGIYYLASNGDALAAEQRDRRRRPEGRVQLRRHDNRRPGRRRARRYVAARDLDDLRRRRHLGAGDVDHARPLVAGEPGRGRRRRAARLRSRAGRANFVTSSMR